MEKKIVLVDMDGVIADFEKGFLNAWQEKYPHEVSIPLNERTSFYIRDNYPKELHEKIDAIYFEKGFFINLEPIEGSIQALKDMSEAGHEVFICSNPILQYEYCVLEKYMWVEKYLGREWVKRIILAREKTMIVGDYMIDDNPHMRDLIKTPSWKRIVFDRPYNKAFTKAPSLHSWSEWRSVIT